MSRFRVVRNMAEGFRRLRKFAGWTNGGSYLQELRFEFADAAVVGDEAFDVVAALVVGLLKCMIEPFEKLLLHAVGDFQVHDLAAEIARFFDIYFSSTVVGFRSCLSVHFGMFRHLRF